MSTTGHIPCIDVLCGLAFASKDVATMATPDVLKNKKAAAVGKLVMPKHDADEADWHDFLGLCVLGGVMVGLPSFMREDGELADTTLVSADENFELRSLTLKQAADMLAGVTAAASKAVVADPRRVSNHGGWVEPDLGKHLELIEDAFKVNVINMIELVLVGGEARAQEERHMMKLVASRDFAVSALHTLLNSPENWPIWFVRLVLALRALES